MNTARAVTAQLADLLRREHAALADFLVALADFDRRRLWVELGHSSLFYFLHREPVGQMNQRPLEAPRR